MKRLTHPQPFPKTVQRKVNQPARPQTRAPQAPPPYRPQALPKCLQPKAAAPRQTPGGGAKATPPPPPPVYRPAQKKVVQPKSAAITPARNPPKAPPVYRPEPTSPRPKYARPAPAAAQAKPAGPAPAGAALKAQSAPGRGPAVRQSAARPAHAHVPLQSARGGVIQGRFRGDPVKHCYIDEDTGDEYDALGSWETYRVVTRRTDGLQVRVDLHTNEPINETEESRLLRLNRHPRQAMASFASQAHSSGSTREKDIYNMYSDYNSPHPLPEDQYGAYLNKLAQIDVESWPRVESYPQCEDDRDDRYSTRRTITNNPDGHSPRSLASDFYRAESTGGASGPTLSRITLRLNPHHATKVWDFISKRLVGRYGVKNAKIGGPKSVSERSDSVIIYLNTNHVSEARNIAHLLASEFPPDHFEDGVPFGMLELGRGIGYAERHPTYSSHGSARSAAVELALRNLNTHRQRLLTQGLNLDEATAQHLLVSSFLPDAMRSLGINSSDPHENTDDDEYYFSTSDKK